MAVMNGTEVGCVTDVSETRIYLQHEKYVPM